ncbi:MAG: hypothetical protein AAF656_01280 [Planctomycetota bacterium]
MRFLPHNLPEDVVATLTELGHTHEPVPPGDLQPLELFKLCRSRQAELLTTDGGLAEQASIALLGKTRLAVHLREPVPGAVRKLFDRFKRLTPGRLYTATASHAKVKQLAARLDHGA